MVRIAKHLSAVDKSAFTDILHGHIHNCSLQHMVVYSGLCICNSLTVFTWKILFGMHNAHIRQLVLVSKFTRCSPPPPVSTAVGVSLPGAIMDVQVL